MNTETNLMLKEFKKNVASKITHKVLAKLNNNEGNNYINVFEEENKEAALIGRDENVTLTVRNFPQESNNYNDNKYINVSAQEKNKKGSNGMEPNLLIPSCNNCNKSKYLNVFEEENKETTNVAPMVNQVSTNYDKYNNSKYINLSINNNVEAALVASMVMHWPHEPGLHRHPGSIPSRSASTSINSKYKIKKVPIQDIKPRQYVLSLNESSGNVVPAKVKALLDMGYKPIYELITESGRAINTTGNHPYLVKADELSERELEKGDKIIAPVETQISFLLLKSDQIKFNLTPNSLNLVSILNNSANTPPNSSSVTGGEPITPSHFNIMTNIANDIKPQAIIPNIRLSSSLFIYLPLDLSINNPAITPKIIPINTLNTISNFNNKLNIIVTSTRTRAPQKIVLYSFDNISDINAGNYLKLLNFDITSTPCCLRNVSNLLFTFSSLRNLGFEGDTELDIVSTPSEICSILQSCFDMILSQGGEIFDNFIYTNSSFKHFQNLPDHDSSTFESGLSVTDFSICDNILIDFNSHGNYAVEIYLNFSEVQNE